MNYEQKQKARRERYLEKAKKAYQKSEEFYQSASKKVEMIPFGQPILVGHHSEKSDRAFRAKIENEMDKSIKEAKKAEYYERKAEAVGRGGISSDDENAKKKLEDKILKLQKFQEKMKEENAKARKEKREKPFPQYALTNNNAKIRQAKKRLQEMEQIANDKQVEFIGKDWKIFEEDNIIKFVSDEKPSEEIRSLLKSYGFRWSRYSTAWVRKITLNARFASRRLGENLRSLPLFE